MELESNRLKEDLGYDFDQELPVLLRSKRTRYDQIYDHRMARNTCPIQVHEFSVTSMGGKNLFVSLTCDETTDAMSRICEVFESLKLKIITANIPTLSELVKKTVLIEKWLEEKDKIPTGRVVHHDKTTLYLKHEPFGFSLSQFMDIIENIGEYQNYWETSWFWNEELNYSWATNQQSNLGCNASSLPEGTGSPIRAKNIDSKRKKRKELNDKLLALRGAVPKISKLDKASIIKDAIEYIQDLQEQERILQAEIREHESKRLMKHPDSGFEQELPDLLRSKRTRYDQIYHHSLGRSTCPIQVHELAITSMGEKTLLVSFACNKTTDAMSRIYEVFESLKLKIITANATALSGMVKKTVVIEVDDEEKEHLKIKIERAVSALRSPHAVQ